MLRRATKAALAALLLLAALVAAAIAWPRAQAPLADAGDDYAVTNVRVIDVESGTAGPVTAVSIRDGIIAAIGPAEAGLPQVDGGGGYLVPGFWDMHMHSFQLSPQLHLPLYLAHGVTGVRDMMDCPGARDSLIACVSDKRRWSADAARGRLAGPRFVSVASYYLEKPDLVPAEISARAADARARGIDELKVYNRLARPAYLHAAAEAQRRGLRLVGHLPRALALEEALANGQSSFEHAHLFVRHCYARAGDWRSGALAGADPTRLAEAMVAGQDPKRCAAAFAAMRAAGAWFVPTHVTREEDARAGDPAFVGDPRLDYLDPMSRWAFRDDLGGTRSAYPGVRGEQALQAYFREGLRLTGAAYRAGVPVLVGTDTAIGGFRYHDEMAWLVRAGLTPAQVLRAATLDAARYAGMERSFGSIAVGKRADLLILAANPLEDIAATRSIRSVFLGGRHYDRRRLDELLRFVRGQSGRPDIWAKLLWGFARSSVTSDL
ncbi:MAG TPA: amidohydrolase family protein [Allosphingosinicella sp.]|jgi:hypothetical protein